MKLNEAVPENSRDVFKLTRFIYWIQSGCEYMTTLLSGGVFLAKLTSGMGISDGMTAVLTSISTFATLAQFASIYISKRQHPKHFIMPIMLISHLIFAAMFLLPLTGGTERVLIAVFFAMLTVGRFAAYSIVPSKTTWYFGLVPPAKRGIYASVNNIVSMSMGIAIPMIVSIIVDKFEATGNTRAVFITISIAIFIFAILNLTALLISREKQKSTNESKRMSTLKGFKTLVRIRDFRSYSLVIILLASAGSIALPFFYTYQMNELGFSVTYCSIIETVANISLITSVILFGKISTKSSFRKILCIGYPLFAAAYLFAAFIMPSNGSFMYIVFIIVLRIGTGAANVAQTNHLLGIVDEELQTSAISITSAFSGISGFATTLIVSPFIDFVQKRGNQLFGFTVYAQQILSVAACGVYLIAALSFILLTRKRSSKADI